MSKLLLIPSARLIPSELQTDFGAIPSAMIPMGGQPALRYIAEDYVADGFDVAVAVHDNAVFLEEYLQNHPDLHAQAIDVGETRSLGASVLHVLKQVDELPECLVINFGDTYVAPRPSNQNVVYIQQCDELFRWTTFEIGPEGQILNIIDKNHEKFDSNLDQIVFVGVFSLDHVADFVQILEQCVASTTNGPLDPFYLAIQSYFNQLPVEDRIFQKAEEWWDFGHLDNYYEVKRSRYLSHRFFNAIRVDTDRGIIRKASQNAQTLITEISWYLRLPSHLRYAAPRVFDYNLDLDNPYVEIEFYGYPALADVYLYGNYSPETWRKVFLTLEKLIGDMHSYRFEPQDDTLQTAMREMYEDKTRNRLKSIVADERFAPFLQDEVVINDRVVIGLAGVLDRLNDVIDNVRLYDYDHFTVIHGDLCLSNILYDLRNRFVRVIDPRGRFGSIDGIFGDPRYDLAKLSHSLEGNYDFFVNGLVDAEWRDGKFYYRPYLGKRHHHVKRLFRQWLLRNWGDDFNEIKFIESLLFLSMLPIHGEDFKRQQVLMAKGLEIFTSVVRGTTMSIERDV